jgi:hypothetical protein
MPRGDRTGPSGLGPMTGRGMGFCSGYDMPGYLNPGAGYGRGMAYGRGRGMGRGMAWGRGRGAGWSAPPAYGYGSPYGSYGYYGPPSYPNPDDERTFIEEELKDLKAHMQAMEKRLGELKEKKESE